MVHVTYMGTWVCSAWRRESRRGWVVICCTWLVGCAGGGSPWPVQPGESTGLASTTLEIAFSFFQRFPCMVISGVHRWAPLLLVTPGSARTTLCPTLGSVVGTQDTSYCHEASAEPGMATWGAGWQVSQAALQGWTGDPQCWTCLSFPSNPLPENSHPTSPVAKQKTQSLHFFKRTLKATISCALITQRPQPAMQADLWVGASCPFCLQRGEPQPAWAWDQR